MCEHALSDAARVHPLAVRRVVAPYVVGERHLASVARVLAVASSEEDRPQLREWLNHSQAEVRAAACEGLMRVGAREDADAVMPRLLDEEPAVRAAAARALEKLGGAEHADAILARTADEDGEVVRAAFAALVRLAPARAVERLLEAVSGTDGRAASAALAAAESLGGGTALLAGSRALSHPDVRVVRAALHALGEAGSKDAAAMLAPLFKDARWEVRHAAAQALWRLRQGGFADAAVLKRAQEALKEERDPLVREALGLALGSGEAA